MFLKDKIYNSYVIIKAIHGVKNLLIKRILKYITVGTVGFGVNFGVLYLLTEYLGWYFLISAIFSFFAGNMFTFIFDKTWTFNENFMKNFFKEYKTFFSFSTLALIMNLLILSVFTNVIGIYYLYSQIVSIIFIGVTGFIFNRRYTFRKCRK